MELLQTQKADVEQLARRWQDDNRALQARLDAASQRLERLTVERDEAVRARYTFDGYTHCRRGSTSR